MIKLTNQTLYDNCLAEKQEQQQTLILQALTQDDPDVHCLTEFKLKTKMVAW